MLSYRVNYLYPIKSEMNFLGKNYDVVYNGNDCRYLHNGWVYTTNCTRHKNQRTKRRFTANAGTLTGRWQFVAGVWDAFEKPHHCAGKWVHAFVCRYDFCVTSFV